MCFCVKESVCIRESVVCYLSHMYGTEHWLVALTFILVWDWLRMRTDMIGLEGQWNILQVLIRCILLQTFFFLRFSLPPVTFAIYKTQITFYKKKH